MDYKSLLTTTLTTSMYKEIDYQILAVNVTNTSDHYHYVLQLRLITTTLPTTITSIDTTKTTLTNDYLSKASMDHY